MSVEIMEKTKQSVEGYKIRRTIILCVLMFIQAVALYTGYGNMPINFLVVTVALLDCLWIAFWLMAMPIVVRMKTKEKIPYHKGKRICIWNSIGLFLVSIITMMMGLPELVNGGSAVIFYYINMWFFVEKPTRLDWKDRRRVKGIIGAILLILQAIAFYGCYVTNDFEELTGGIAAAYGFCLPGIIGILLLVSVYADYRKVIRMSDECFEESFDLKMEFDTKG